MTAVDQTTAPPTGFDRGRRAGRVSGQATVACGDGLRWLAGVVRVSGAVLLDRPGLAWEGMLRGLL